MPKIRVVLEPTIPDHDPDLYRSDLLGQGIAGWSAFDEAQVAFYRDQGYLLIRNGFSASDVAAGKDELQRMITEESPACESVYYEGFLAEQSLSPDGLRVRERDGSLVENLALGNIADRLPDLDPEVRAKCVRKVMGFVNGYPALAALATQPEMMAILERLAGGPVKVFQDMAMIKPPRGREKPWHQDHAYFNVPIETPIVGVWIAMDRATLENGCMFVLAGNHREGPQPHFMRRDWQICDDALRSVPQTAVPMEPGDVLLFDSKLPHGTPINRTDQYRWSVQFHYRPADATETGNEERLGLFGGEGLGVSC